MRMFLIYPEGNFIEATEDNPFFQIGEHKYGKPILVRAYDPDMSFEHRQRSCSSVSFDIDAEIQPLGRPATGPAVLRARQSDQGL